MPMRALIGVGTVILAALALRGARWAYAAFVGVGLFAARAGFRLEPLPWSRLWRGGVGARERAAAGEPEFCRDLEAVVRAGAIDAILAHKRLQHSGVRDRSAAKALAMTARPTASPAKRGS
jgi:hypothetical protein